ncbi:hypothetical protein HanXRQr2_Chr09g0365821 [Helianthus annuus]|uniref:Uncharacterized protein n=1 Tax=Helianthus annuus TaxID=4232 RepID=A0A9K3N794_HELAN|nr:hypothetical protein HanXRQr2_Chr09g0365821 [Helianthus annuus]KAJ0891335.1 hypothetical protein HanPSC8_Chr09g0352511 [Helianthus annuus]
MSTRAFHNNATISCTFEGLCVTILILSFDMIFSLSFVIVDPLNENTRKTQLFITSFESTTTSSLSRLSVGR